MRKLLFILIVVGLTSTLSLSTVKSQNSKTKSEQKSSLSILNGSWKRIGVIVNGKAESNPLPQIRLFHEGFFSIIGQDSTQSWKVAYGGTYEISDNIYKETMLYCTFPGLVGVTHWQELSIKGDTVSFKLFKKMIDATGKDIAAPEYTREIICVRVKK
jgi:hypothetical protein